MINVFNILPCGQVWSFPGWPGRAGLAGSSRRHAYAELSAVRAALPASCLSPETARRSVFKSSLVTIESERHSLSPQHTWSTAMDSFWEGSQVPCSCPTHGCSEAPNFLLGSWVQESRGMWASKCFPGEDLYIDSRHTDLGFHFLKSVKCWWYEEKIKQNTGKNKSSSAHWPPPTPLHSLPQKQLLLLTFCVLSDNLHI